MLWPISLRSKPIIYLLGCQSSYKWISSAGDKKLVLNETNNSLSSKIILYFISAVIANMYIVCGR